jgi:hypothetical protein
MNTEQLGNTVNTNIAQLIICTSMQKVDYIYMNTGRSRTNI